MNLFQRLGAAFRAIATGSALPPWDDWYYSRPGWEAASGMSVTPESAMQLAAVYACVRVASETIASLPLIIYKRLPGGAKQRATEHPLYKILHDTPNQWQTSLEFIEMMQAHLELRGNAFAVIVPSPRRAIDQLIPQHPDLVQVYRLPNGRLKYQVRSRFTSEVDWYTQDEMFHLRGLSSDGLVGLSPIAVQRETIGAALGIQDHGSRWFRNSAVPSGILKHPGKFKDDAAREKYRSSFIKSQTAGNQYKVAILEDGLDYKSLGVSNRDSQFLEASGAKAIEIAGIYRIPPHKIGILDKASHSNVEQQNIEFVTDSIRSRVVRWERRINTDLVDPMNEVLGGDYFVEFLIDGLLRGDLLSRMQAYAIARQWGLMSPNDVARTENWDPIPSEKGGDDYWRPVNMVPTDASIAVQQVLPPGETTEKPDGEQAPKPPNKDEDDPPPEEGDDEGSDAPDTSAAADRRLLELFATEAAGRLVRKEVASLRKSLARSPDSFDGQAREFYREHVAFIALAMCISPELAGKYASANLKKLCACPDPQDKACLLDWIEDTAAQELASLALGQRKPPSLLPEGANR